VDEFERWATLAQIEVCAENADTFRFALQDSSSLVRELAVSQLKLLGLQVAKSDDSLEILGEDFVKGYHGSIRGFAAQVDHMAQEIVLAGNIVKNNGLPQADDLNKVLSVCEQIFGLGEADFDTLLTTWDLSPRQLRYYLEAAVWLGLLHSMRGVFSPSLRWKYISQYQGYLRLAATIAVLRTAPIPILEKSNFDNGEIANEVLGALSMSTATRRVGTLRAWSAWIGGRMEALRGISTPDRQISQLTTSFFSCVETTIGMLPKRELLAFARSRFTPQGVFKVTLEAIGMKLNLTRERVRQIEKQVANRIRIENEIDLGRSREDVLVDLSSRPWVNILDLLEPDRAFAGSRICAVKTALEFLGFNLTDASWPFAFSNEADTLVAEYLTHRLPLPLSEFGLSSDFFGAGIAEFLQVVERLNSRIVVQRGLVVRGESARVDVATWILKNSGPLPIERFAELTGEENIRAFVEFLRRTPEINFNHQTHTYSLAKDGNQVPLVDPRDRIEHFLEENSPSSLSEIFEDLYSQHPVSRTRVLQYLDDERFGKIASGYGLVRKGARRRPEVEPTMPTNLISDGSKVTMLAVVSEDMDRGSGFALPRWLGWRLSLSASPQFFEFRHLLFSFSPLRITRRGGAIWSSSIKNAITEIGANVGCHVSIYFDIERATWDASHDCR